MVESIRLWNLERTAAGLIPIHLGISVHHGIVVAGNMGALDRLNYTVVGAEVNLGARLCSAAGPDQILVTDAIRLREEPQNHFKFELLGPIQLKGISDPVTVYSVTL